MDKSILKYKNKPIHYYKENLMGFNKLSIRHQNLIFKLIQMSLDDEYIIKCKYLDEQKAIDHFIIFENVAIGYKLDFPTILCFKKDDIFQENIQIDENFKLFSQKIKENVIIYKKLKHEFLFQNKKKNKQNKISLLDLD
jgi:hypothetical protein